MFVRIKFKKKSDSHNTENNISRPEIYLVLDKVMPHSEQTIGGEAPDLTLPLQPPPRFWSNCVVHRGFCFVLLFDKVLKNGYSLLNNYYMVISSA